MRILDPARVGPLFLGGGKRNLGSIAAFSIHTVGPVETALLGTLKAKATIISKKLFERIMI